MIEQRFYDKVKKTDTCWLWQGAKYSNGYGVILAEGRPKHNISAHRLSWQIHNGEIPQGMHVLHHCDNPGCVVWQLRANA